MYIYPDNLKSKAVMWLWELKDLGIIAVGTLISILALTQTGIMIPLAVTAGYAVLSISAIIADEKLKAYASVCVNDSLLIKGIKIIDGKHGRFVAMPCRKTKNGEFKDITFPITAELRKEVEQAVLEAYSKKLEEM